MDFYVNLYTSDYASGAGLTAVPTIQTIITLLICLANSVDITLKEDASIDNIRLPGVTTPVNMTPTPLAFQLIEYVFTTFTTQLLTHTSTHTNTQGGGLLRFLYTYGTWVSMRILKCVFISSQLSFHTIVLDNIHTLNNTNITYIQHIINILSNIIGFHIYEYNLLHTSLNMENIAYLCIHSLKMAVIDCASVLFGIIHTNDINMLQSTYTILTQSPFFNTNTTSLYSDTYYMLLITQRVCMYLTDSFFVGFKQNAHLQNIDVLTKIYPQSFYKHLLIHSSSSSSTSNNNNNATTTTANTNTSQEVGGEVGGEVSECLEDILLTRLQPLDLAVLVSNDISNMDINTYLTNVYYGELHLLKILQNMRIKVYHSCFATGLVNQIEMHYNTLKCSSDLKISTDGKECIHIGSKAWTSVFVIEGFLPKTGVHEFTARIDKCDKVTLLYFT